MSSEKIKLVDEVFGSVKNTITYEQLHNINGKFHNISDKFVENISESISEPTTINSKKKTSELIFSEETLNNVEIIDTEPYLSDYHKHAIDFENDVIMKEPILSLKSEQYTVHPIKYQKVWDNYKDQMKNYWTVEEVDLAKDVNDWNNHLSDDDRNFIMHVLAFFAAADGIVNANIKENLIDVVKIKEAECAYGFQYAMENAHGEMYSLMLTTFVKDDALRNKLINSIKTMPSIKKKADWCNKWIKSDKTYAHKLVAFSIVEGVFFSGSFASIFWLKTREMHVMPGLIISNQFIARDENKHVELACIMYSLLNNRLKESVVYQIIDEAIEIEEEFINDSLPCKLLGMNSELMSQYIKYVADRLLVDLGYRKKFNVDNPFEYMKKIDVFVKANFFEKRNDAYSNANIDNEKKIVFLENF
ncbi:ribonucleoside-diphosphate reductase small chain [Acanthamoeba castellanii mimivirus]|uniref:Ribonucleoside-diphosphate reductase small chain n=5 Tax=Mimivirus TaxID=315393 RepID=RIR2_MIMIV|nr:ribonucleoside-diphosphate reductase small chain [Acanthamoeba polyphaga mimivirus]Q7T6Y9.2 RecName: Full=Ribonucleoside-diphosphate reductase small chain; AltName: Full=Ribonucleotide reductase small subunit [Acanthamoeba polyphaga mimivirus]AHA45552.1 ribonucleoside-diphosphate reductase small chain [Hirudovirus strain Sangsue]ALR83892.1 ribonucleoside-diphosphate reductase small chain [Niemeyer virus]AMK61852.1 ribonucleotide reductase small subunit [Samba virus]AMZ02759.1 ribonucleoside